MHMYPFSLKFRWTKSWVAGFFLTILLTDGQEGAEENVTHQQYGFQTVLLPEFNF